MPNHTSQPRSRINPNIKNFIGVSDSSIQEISKLFNTAVHRESYYLSANKPTFRINYRSRKGNIAIILWPAIDRVDVHCGPHSWIAKNIITTKILSEIEVIFRMSNGGLLFISIDGEIMMVNGSK